MKNFLLLIFIVGFLSCQKEKNPELAKSNLIAYFSFDSSYIDASENSNQLQIYGDPEFTEGINDEPSTALLLDGEEDYLKGFIGKLDTFSISMWLESYRSFVDEWPPRRSTFFDYSNKQVHGYIDGMTGATQIHCGIESEQLASIDFEGGDEWSHLYMAVSNELKIYLNGILLKTESLQKSLIYLNDTIYFGRPSSDDDLEKTFFNGKIDEIRVFKKILDQEEIDELSSR